MAVSSLMVHQQMSDSNSNNYVGSQEGLAPQRTEQEEPLCKDATRQDDQGSGGHEKPKCPVVVTMGVVFVVIGFVWGTYLWLHTLRLQDNAVSKAEKENILVHTIIANVLTALLLTHYWIAHCMKPGSIPKNYIWVEGTAMHCLETKGDGDKRYCKWCEVYKPDRAHHCRLCGECVLRMDHHCPWLGNCVGFHNHKYFINTVIFGLLSAAFMFGSMVPTSVRNFADMQAHPGNSWKAFLFGATVFVQVVQLFVTVVLCGFFSFHMYLMCKGMTTIEFCERRRSQNTADYNNGCWANYRAVFGENPVLSCCPCPCVPCAKPKGDGTRFRGRVATPDGKKIVGGKVVAEGDYGADLQSSESEDEVLIGPPGANF
eukprot:g7840.t1